MRPAVEPVAWGWWCDECIAGGRYESLEVAEVRAARHDRENHGADS